MSSTRGIQMISKWEGNDLPQSVIGFELRPLLEDPYFKPFVDYIEQWKQDLLSKNVDENCFSTSEKHLSKLKSQLQNTETRITIKVELINYE